MKEKIRQIKFSRLKPEIKLIYKYLNKVSIEIDKDRTFILYEDTIVGTYSTISKNVFLSWSFFNYMCYKEISDFDYLEQCVLDVLSDVLQIEISELYITKIDNIKKSVKELEYEVKY